MSFRSQQPTHNATIIQATEPIGVNIIKILTGIFAVRSVTSKLPLDSLPVVERQLESDRLHFGLYDNFCNKLDDVDNLCRTGDVDCTDSLEIPRKSMPQFTTFVEVKQMITNLNKEFGRFQDGFMSVNMRAKLNYKDLQQKNIVLRPIQNQISGPIEQKICEAYQAGEWQHHLHDVAVIVVTSKKQKAVKYVLDGHHRAFGWLLSKNAGWLADNTLPVIEITLDQQDSREAARTVFWNLYYNMPVIFKEHDI